MPRIRTIKPEFWADEKMAPLPPIDRLVFLGLISMADDGGRVLDNIRVIDAFIFPETSDTARESIATLSRMRRIRRGITPSGQRIIQIVGWAHQKVDKPNMAAALPEIQTYTDEQVTEIRDGFANDSRENRDTLATHINYQRSTTNDLLPSLSAAPTNGTLPLELTPDPEPPAPKRKPAKEPLPNWVTEATAMYEALVGILPPGRIGKALKPAVDRYGWMNEAQPNNCVKRWWDAYCRYRPYQRADGSIWGDKATDVGPRPTPNMNWTTPEDFMKGLAKWRDECTAPTSR